MKKLLILFIIMLPVYTIADCWTSAELAMIESYELEEQIALAFKSKNTCKPIENVELEIGEFVYKSNMKGLVLLPYAGIDELDDMEIPVVFKRVGYETLLTKLKIINGFVKNKLFVLSEKE